jgi:aspartate kinase
MRIFKFGGASVKDADGVRRVASVLNHFAGDEILIVVSAMGKTTNALENLVSTFLKRDVELCKAQLSTLIHDHQQVLLDLFKDSSAPVFKDVAHLFEQLETILAAAPKAGFNQVYDQIVSFGELLSTKIVSAYLNSINLHNHWLDARRLIRTDKNFRAARIDWNFTRRLVLESIKDGSSYVIQGFIASDDDFNSTTLGREGSDYTASVLAFVLQADEVVIWKDVPGVLNGDPKVFEKTQLLKQISYREAIELAFYGASVIHPKTIQPLQERGIPLRVCSFENPLGQGSTISEGVALNPFLPCFIRKDKQQLISLKTRDLAFIAEDHLSKIYKLFYQFGLRVNLSQHAATSSSFCVNNDPIATPSLLEELQQSFDLTVVEDLELYTVRHYDNDAIALIQSRGRKLLEQIGADTYQIVLDTL